LLQEEAEVNRKNCRQELRAGSMIIATVSECGIAEKVLVNFGTTYLRRKSIDVLGQTMLEKHMA